jgi:hypothetical protein
MGNGETNGADRLGLNYQVESWGLLTVALS